MVEGSLVPSGSHLKVLNRVPSIPTATSRGAQGRRRAAGQKNHNFSESEESTIVGDRPKKVAERCESGAAIAAPLEKHHTCIPALMIFPRKKLGFAASLLLKPRPNRFYNSRRKVFSLVFCFLVLRMEVLQLDMLRP